MKQQPTSESWGWATRMAFRFCFIYFGLFALATQVTGSLLPIFSFRGLGPIWPMRELTLWVASHVFGVPPTERSIDPGQGGETVFFWVQAFWLLGVAVAGTGVWSYLDRKTANHRTLYTWFRLFLRLGLAAQMLEYGMTKILRTQFEPPSLNTLMTPVGGLSLNNALWASIGAAPGYQIFTGCAELLAGILLLIPATTLLGALLCLADLALVLTLNLTYDIGLKLTTIHLILLTLFLLAHYARPLANFFLLGRAADPAVDPPLFKKAAANRAAVALQMLLGVYLLITLAYINVGFWYEKGGGKARSALYGIWDVEELVIDGQARPAELNDYDRRWRRAIFDAPDKVSFQRTDDSFAHYDAKIDSTRNTLGLRKRLSPTWHASFVFQQPLPDRLFLFGEMDGHRIDLRLRLVEFDTLPLLNSGFRWMRPVAE
jgi:uncharacterized membrane protein YphA (DoxX/SURF4 family)